VGGCAGQFPAMAVPASDSRINKINHDRFMKNSLCV